MTLAEQIVANTRRIGALAASMEIWKGTPHAQKREVRAQIMEIQDRTLHRLQELEVSGQHAKIAGMEKVISLLKAGK